MTDVIKRSVSFQTASKTTSPKHNRRATKEDASRLVNRGDHIDSDRTHLNKHLLSGDIHDRFNKLFKSDLDAYNEKQKKPSRRIDDYYDFISKKAEKKRGTMRPYYESILQVGKMGESIIPNSDFKTDALERLAQRDVFELFLKRFEEKYNQPDMATRIVPMQADIHFDEASPHMHFIWTPYADGYKTSLAHKPSLSKALERLGYGGRGKEAYAAFMADQQDLLFECAQEVASEYGEKIERVRPGSTKHLDYMIYKKQAQEELSAIDDLKAQKNDLTEQVQTGYSSINDLKAQVTALREQSLTEIKSLTDQITQLKKEKDDAWAEIEYFRAEKKQAYEERNEMKNSLSAIYDERASFWGDYKDQMKTIYEDRRKVFKDPEKLAEWSHAAERLRTVKEEQYRWQKKSGAIAWTVNFLLKIREKAYEKQLEAMKEERQRALADIKARQEALSAEKDKQLAFLQSQIDDKKQELASISDYAGTLTAITKKATKAYHDAKDMLDAAKTERNAMRSELENRLSKVELEELKNKNDDQSSIITGKAVALANDMTSDDYDKLLQVSTGKMPPAKKNPDEIDMNDVKLNLDGLKNASDGRQRR